MPTVCLITPGHVASTPRLVKEADALVEAGYRVHVVAGRHYAPVKTLDATLLENARWQYTPVDYSGGSRVWIRKVVRRVARQMMRYAPVGSVRLAARVQHAETLELARASRATGADFFIGHCLAGLAAAGLAAQANAARLGFDAEDWHDGETEHLQSDAVARKTAERLQRTFLPRCAYVTASSPLIAQAYREKYGVDPRVVLNVFPRSEAPPKPIDPGEISATAPARFYWFSQTIGPGRGLEYVLSVLGRMHVPATLELRGLVSDDYRAELSATATQAGVKRTISFLPPAPPPEMVRLAATAHLGLSLEEPTPRNHDLCLANKIYTYLLAGVPQLLTPTSGQRLIASDLANAALLAERDEAETAKALDEFLADPVRYSAARATAWRLAQERFCWEVEQRTFLEAVARSLEPDPRAKSFSRS